MIRNDNQINMGRYSYAGNVEISRYDITVKLIVGNFCSISNGVKFLLGGHHMSKWVTTFPFYNSWLQNQNPEMPKYHDNDYSKAENTIIGHDVWIGKDAMILSGVKIGNGCIIGAGAVVRPTIYDVYGNGHKSVPAYSIVIGNPGVITGSRIDPQYISRMQEIAWWNWSDEKIQEAMPLMLKEDISGFIKKYGKE